MLSITNTFLAHTLILAEDHNQNFLDVQTWANNHEASESVGHALGLSINNNTPLYFKDTNGNNSAYLRKNGTNIFNIVGGPGERIQMTGGLDGINSVTHFVFEDVNGDDILQLLSSADNNQLFVRGANNKGGMLLAYDVANSKVIYIAHDGTDGTVGVSSGAFKFNASVNPSSDGGKQLGASGARWDNLSLYPTTQPSNLEGRIYYNAATHHFYGYTGSAWVQLDN